MKFMEIWITQTERCALTYQSLLKYDASTQSLFPFMGYRTANREKK